MLVVVVIIVASNNRLGSRRYCLLVSLYVKEVSVLVIFVGI